MGISCISQTHLRLISWVFQAYVRHISWVSQSYLIGISGIFQAHLRPISGISQAFLRHISGVSQSYKSSIPLVYHRHMSGKSKSSVTTKYHSYLLFITFIDSEIFAAYAGSCLLVNMMFICTIIPVWQVRVCKSWLRAITIWFLLVKGSSTYWPGLV